MRAPLLRLHTDELIVDSFAGGGGASLGIEWALGRSPDIAINHDAEAIAMHAANHPATRHYCESVWDVDPVQACGGRPVGLAWFSPDCKHFSKAKGGKPVEKKIRGLAWIVVKWAKTVRPRVICLENVEEFQSWGPLVDGRPCPARKGFTFRRWVSSLRQLGYVVEMRELRASDYGAPTSRKRLFVVARCDGQPIVWPEPTHGPGRLPYHVAAECIEWAVPCPSIFERGRPLAENTLRRIARGVWRYVINAAEPFIVPMQHDNRPASVDEPLQTVTTQGNKFNLIMPFLAGVGGRMGQSPERPVDAPYHTTTAKADTVLVTPFITEHANASNQRNMRADEPLRTQCAQVKGGHFALVAPTLIETRNGEREGQSPRVRDIQRPFGTVTAQGSQGGLVAALLARHYGGHENDGAQVEMPLPTVTAKDHHALVTTHMLKLHGTCADGQGMDEPVPTIRAGGTHLAEVRAFLVAYFGNEKDGAQLDLPMRTVTSKDRFGLVTVHGIDYAIADIGMRMLLPRELFRAQGFPDGYVIDTPVRDKPMTKTAQVRMCGNSVCPPLAAAIARAQFAGAEAAVSA